MSWFRTNRRTVHHVKARPGVPPASAALTSSLPPPFLLPLVAVSTLQYNVVAPGEESQNCINPYAKPPSLETLRQRLRGNHTLHSIVVQVLAASLRGTVVLQHSRSQEPCEYPLECFKIVDIFLQDPKNNASIDL